MAEQTASGRAMCTEETDRITQLEAENARLRDFGRRRSARADRLREAGEAMFKVLIRTGCVHHDPRHPRNENCQHCQRRARAMDEWDEALIPGSRAASDEHRATEGDQT